MAQSIDSTVIQPHFTSSYAPFHGIVPDLCVHVHVRAYVQACACGACQHVPQLECVACLPRSAELGGEPAWPQYVSTLTQVS